MVSAQQSGLAVDGVCERSIEDDVWPNNARTAFSDGVKDIGREVCNRYGVLWGYFSAALAAQ